MEIIQPDSSWNDFPTEDQLGSIRKAYLILNGELREENMPRNRWEARNLNYELWNKVRIIGRRR